MPKVSEEHSAARRTQIIEAAYRCFARKGFHQTTMREIYEEAGLSPGAVYHYFDGKDSIIRASFDFDRERSSDLFERAVQSDSPMDALRELAAFFFQGLESASEIDAGRVNVQGWAEALVNPSLLAPIQAVMESYVAALSEIVRHAQQLNQIESTLDPVAVARLLLSIYYGLELQKALFPHIPVAPYRKAVEKLVLTPTNEEHAVGHLDLPDGLAQSNAL